MIIDLTVLSLGIETVGGIMTKIIPRNTVMPCEQSAIFTTNSDNQTSVEIKVFEGERMMVSGNHFLKSFKLDGISPSPRGIPKIQITIQVDVNGIIIVSAQDLSSSNCQKITIPNDNGYLSYEYIMDNINKAKTDSNIKPMNTDSTELGLLLCKIGEIDTTETDKGPLLMLTHSKE